MINGITNERTNSLTNIGKDEQTNGKTKLYTPRHKRWGITSVDLDILFRIFKDRMYIVTRNTPLKHWNNKCPDQPAHHRSYGRLCLCIKNKYCQSFRQVGYVRPDLVPHCLETKNDREDAPTHSLADIPGIAHERHTRIKSGGPGPLTIAVFLFNDPLTVKVI